MRRSLVGRSRFPGVDTAWRTRICHPSAPTRRPTRTRREYRPGAPRGDPVRPLVPHRPSCADCSTLPAARGAGFLTAGICTSAPSAGVRTRQRSVVRGDVSPRRAAQHLVAAPAPHHHLRRAESGRETASPAGTHREHSCYNDIIIISIIIVITRSISLAGPYPYMGDLQALDAARPPELGAAYPELGRISSPLTERLSRWRHALANHPDQVFARYILEGIQRGFRVGFDHRTTLASSARNMPSARVHPDVIGNFITAELAGGPILAWSTVPAYTLIGWGWF